MYKDCSIPQDGTFHYHYYHLDPNIPSDPETKLLVPALNFNNTHIFNMKFIYTTIFALAAVTMAAPASEIFVEKRCLGAGGTSYPILALLRRTL